MHGKDRGRQLKPRTRVRQFGRRRREGKPNKTWQYVKTKQGGGWYEKVACNRIGRIRMGWKTWIG